MQGKQALEGIKVADFTWAGVGPITSKYLADHGATVVHVESHSRLDICRGIRPFHNNIPHPDRTGIFANFNSSKCSISLDLNKPRGQELALELIKWADVVVESYTPKAMKAWGLDYESVRRVKPDIVYLSTCMQGQYGPHSSYRGWGFQAASLAGAYHISGWPDRKPSPPYGAYTDFVNPPFGVTALLAALDYRRRTGKGQHIDQSQLETALHMFAPAIMDYALSGRIAARNGNRLPYAAPHGAYRCQGDDRWCTIAVFSDEEWRAFCKATGEPPWTSDPRFSTLLGRKRNEDELDRLVEEWASSHSAEEVMAIMEAAGVAAGVVQNTRDLYQDPQLAHRGHFRWLQHSVMGSVPYDGPAFRLPKTPDQQSASPALGEHNEYVLKEILGLSDDEIADLLVEGVITTEADIRFGITA